MINRCRYCGDIAPDYSDMCDSCAELELNEDELPIAFLLEQYNERAKELAD
jgi:RNA polymerase subunit RPABC4/transcription elongation factor Spt4